MFPLLKGFKIPEPSHHGPKLLNSAYRVNALWPQSYTTIHLTFCLRPKWPFQQEPCVLCLLSGQGWGTSDCSFLFPLSLHTLKCPTSSMLARPRLQLCLYLCLQTPAPHANSRLTDALGLHVSSHLSRESAKVCGWHCVLESLDCLMLHLGSLGNSTKFWWFYYSTM